MSSSTSLPLQISFDDGSYAKIAVSATTTAADVCQLVLKKRRIATLTEENAVLCISAPDNEIVPLDQSALVLQVYEDARMNGQTLDFYLKPRESLTDDFWDPHKRKERYSSMSLRQSRRMTQDNKLMEKFSENFIQDYTKKWHGTVDMFGYLDKSGELNTAFKMRFFVLKGHSLMYYKSHADTVPIKKIDVLNCTVKEKDPKELEFSLISPRRIYLLRAMNRTEMLQWIVKLHKQSQISSLENRLFDEYQELTDRIEHIKADAKEKVMKNLYDLKVSLQTDFARECFMNFLERNHSEENLLFWLAVKAYKEKPFQEPQRLHEVAVIFNDYLRQGARHEVAIPADLRKEALSKLKLPDPKRILFDDCLELVLDTIEHTSWVSFKESPFFHELLVEHPYHSPSFPDITSISTGDIELQTTLSNCADSGPNLNLRFFTELLSGDYDDEEKRDTDGGYSGFSSGFSSAAGSERGSPSMSYSRKKHVNKLEDVLE